ncbi:hypothetical protein [Natronoarchaeum rubrum]|uniref:hypothetical protein n=1 Tax=Natronoarchaeum rubrum TaxID=755311 RepID=UPI00211146FE|nr:hypothetical protein [Natronoarchaeum rubrum]
MENRQDITVPMPGAMKEEITEELEYGDTMAEWIREAIRMRLDAESEESVETDGGEPLLAD